jgi:hypothetical protein
MPARLWHGNQAFCVSNATKDLLYEMSAAVAERCHPAAHERLADDVRLAGCYGVSGVGFDLAAFAEAFGEAAAWREAVTRNFDVVEQLCGNPECVLLMRKVFLWSWFLLDGGACNGAAGSHPEVNELPELPRPANMPGCAGRGFEEAW